MAAVSKHRCYCLSPTGIVLRRRDGKQDLTSFNGPVRVVLLPSPCIPQGLHGRSTVGNILDVVKIHDHFTGSMRVVPPGTMLTFLPLISNSSLCRFPSAALSIIST